MKDKIIIEFDGIKIHRMLEDGLIKEAYPSLGINISNGSTDPKIHREEMIEEALPFASRRCVKILYIEDLEENPVTKRLNAVLGFYNFQETGNKKPLKTLISFLFYEIFKTRRGLREDFFYSKTPRKNRHTI